jgi:hypothetical protein
MAKHRTSTKLKRSTVIEPVASSPRELAAWATAPQHRIWRDFHKGCAVCGQGDHEDDPLGLFLDGTKDNQSSWVNQRCWAKWKDRERWQNGGMSIVKRTAQD